MAEKYGGRLLGIMDRLWFHHIILIPEHHSQCLSEAPKNTSLGKSESFADSLISIFQTPSMPEKETSSAADADATTPQKDKCGNQDSEKETTAKERPTRLNLLANKTRSHSSSPSIQKRRKINSPGPRRLQKTMSCKSLRELELEEVKGFMDLGFTFNKEHLTKRIMNLIPGLQRLKEYKREETILLNNKNDKTTDDETEEEEEEEEEEDDDDDDEQHEEEKRVIIRPYLSEAWLIRRPDSPLLNLRVPRASAAAADMKKHLKYWARTVATVIRQES